MAEFARLRNWKTGAIFKVWFIGLRGWCGAGHVLKKFSMDKLRQNMQFAYDSLIRLANSAYDNSKEFGEDIEFGKVWLAKSDAYEWGAHMMDSALSASGIYLDSKVTHKQQDLKEKVVGKKEVA